MRSTYAYLPLTLAVVVISASLISFVLVTAASQASVLRWWASVLVLNALRGLLWLAQRRLDVGQSSPPIWHRLAIAGSLASGILWGSIPWVFWPLDDVHLLFVALVIAGLSAGSATVHAAHFGTATAFILPASLPLAAAFLMQSGRLNIVAAIMVCVFAVSVCLVALNHRRWFNAITTAQLTLARQTAELMESNTRLTAEIESHNATAAKLQQAQKLEAIGRLTAGIAHDFNNILMAIGGSAEMAARFVSAATQVAGFLKTIQTSVGRARTLTQGLLAFGRVQSLQPQSLDVNKILLDMQELIATTLGGLSELTLRLEPTPVFARVDKAHFEQAILNLVINARDAMPNGGLITIKTSRHGTDETESADGNDVTGRFIRVSVWDTGHGMTEGDRVRAFDPFFTTKDVGKGSGLGLSQVYGFAQQSGGSAAIASIEGQGTTVSIDLPVGPAAAAPAADRPAAAAASDAAGARVLLLDDDPDVRETVESILTSAGYAVRACGTVQEALAEVREPPPLDLLVVDYAMPSMRGDQFVAEARRWSASPPVLFITGYANPAHLRSERWVLQKPFNAAQLVEMADLARGSASRP